MGRQRKRAQQRRRAATPPPPPPRAGGPSTTTVVAGTLIVLAIAAALVALVILHGSAVGSPPAAASTPGTASRAPKIDGMPCMDEMVTYHVHAHLAINDAGKPVKVPAYIGIRSTSPTSGCLYWLHTHDDSGMIHIEAPHTIHPTLGMFFDVWGQPLSSHRVASVRVKPGQTMKIWVNRKPYTGNPRLIPLRDLELITIDVGPPYPPEKGFNFSA